jgi:hypothetical protein
MSTLRPSAPRPTYRHPLRTTVVMVLGLALCAGAGWIGWNLFGQGDKKSSSSTSINSSASTTTSSSASCTPTKVPDPGVKIPAKLPDPAKVKVNIYNATKRSGLAARTADQFAARNFVIGTVANDPLDKTIKAVGQVRYGPKGKKYALVVWAQVPQSKLVNDNRITTDVDFAIGNSFDSLASPAEAAAALDPTKASASPSC